MERVQRPTFATPPVPPASARKEDRQPTPPRIDRRAFFGVASALAAITAMTPAAFARNFGPEAEPQRYPEPDVVGLDKRFKYKLGNTPILRLYRGTMWAEGPAWNAVGRYLVWSDIPNDEQLRWLEEDGHVARRFRHPAGNSNGNTFDYQGRQIACEHGNRRVVRYEHDGTVTVLASQYGNKPLNAPNDAVVHPNDGAIWFTDPGYGSLMNYEGHRVKESGASAQPFQKEAIYRIDAQSGRIEKVADEPFKPNGLCFSHDYRRLYVADTGASHYGEAKNVIWMYDVEGSRLGNPRTFASMEYEGKAGFADGIRCDEDGNVWSSAGWVGDGYDGVHIFAPDGDRIGLIRLPEICSNVCFGGSKRNRLFMTGSQSLYAVYVETRGAHIT
jgi:gluconolactonase